MRISDAQLIALRASRRLGESAKLIARHLRTMSSGSISESGAGDSVQLSRTQWLRSQIQQKTLENLNFGQSISRAQIAQSGIESQRELLEKMRELSIRASNDTLSASDRRALQAELSSLLDEMNRVASETEWNGEPLISETRANSILQATVGAGSSTRTTDLTTGSNLTSQAMADFNGDGLMDIVHNDAQNFLSVRLSNGDGTFRAAITSAETGSVGSSLVAADLDGDGITDLVSNTSGFQEVQFLKGHGDGTFAPGMTFLHGSGFSMPTVRVGDYDGDGQSEIFASMGGSYGIYKWNGHGFSSWGSGGVVASGGTLRVTDQDFNNDGRDDIAASQVGSGLLAIYLSDGMGGFTQSATLNSVNFGATPADLNNDGNMDLIGQNNLGSHGYIYLGNGQGGFTLVDDVVPATLWESPVRVLDYNGDGTLDLIGGDQSGNMLVSLGEGGGTFGSVATFSLGFSTDSLFVSDFDGDGVDDFIASNLGGSTSYLFKTNTRSRSALSELDFSSSASAQFALGIIDTALQELLDLSSQWSLEEQRYQLRIDSNLLMSESFESARALIDQPDYALLMSELAAEQIRQQANIAVLAQANLQQRAILALLENL